jgi:hypothetical protein
MVTIADKTSLLAICTPRVGDLGTDITEERWDSAVDAMFLELGWVFPLVDRKAYWGVDRTIRHAIHIQYLSVSSDFQYKQVHLEQPFEHLRKLIEEYDERFTEGLETEIALFNGVVASSIFGTVGNPNYIYDALTGENVTYAIEDPSPFGFLVIK